MLTQVSKDRAVLNGVAVKAERVDLKSYKAGQFFIRAYVNDLGDVQFEVMRIIGKPYASESVYVNDQRINTRPTWADRSYVHPYFVSDLGLTGYWNVGVYRYTAKTLQVLETMRDNQDVENALRFIYGLVSDDVIQDKMIDHQLEREYENEMSAYYRY